MAVQLDCKYPGEGRAMSTRVPDELTMSDSEAIAAIRLAMVGAANDRAAVAVIRTILADVSPSDPGDTESVHRFLEAVKRSRCELAVKS
jgi:hypothetical protein